MPTVVNTKMRSKFPCPSHVTEATYTEIVHFINGEAVVRYQSTVETLLGRGYEVVVDKPKTQPQVKPEPVKISEVLPVSGEEITPPPQLPGELEVSTARTTPSAPPPPPPPPGTLDNDALRSIFG